MTIRAPQALGRRIRLTVYYLVLIMINWEVDVSTIIELSIFPMDKGVSVSPYVSRVLKIVADSGLPFELNSMGTCIEGDWKEVMTVVNRCFEELQADCDRIYLTMKADYRKGRKNGLRQKIASVKSK